MTARAETPRFIAIASGKGGVGKTWFSVTLAHAMARQGRRVLLFDADFGLANVDIQLGLTPRHDLGDVLGGRVTLPQAVTTVAGFDVLAGRSGSGALTGLDTVALQAMLDMLAIHGAAYDHVLLDLGAGLESGVRRLAAWSELLLVIATEDPSSVTDAYATLKLHRADRPGGASVLVVNQAGSAASAGRAAQSIRRACQVFLGAAPALLGFIRRDPRVPEAIRRQALLLDRHPICPAAEDIGRIAAAL